MVAAIFGLLGVVTGAGLTAWLTSRRDHKQRQMAFIERQITELYAPMLGLHMEIRALSNLRVRVQTAADSA